MFKKIFKYLLPALLLVVLVACGEKKTEKKAEATKPSEITVGDIKITVNPKKVVVFDNGALDTLDALGLGEKVIGAPVKNLPAYLKKYKKVENAGGIKEPDLEKINQLKPDLILISGRQQDFQEKLSKIAPTLFLSLDEKDVWASTKENILTLGKIFDKEKLAKEKIDSLEENILKVKKEAEASKKTALVVMANEGQLSAFGSGSRFGIINDVFGFAPADKEIKSSTHGQGVNYEYISQKNPDLLFIVDRTKAIGGDSSKNNIADNALVKETNAGKNGGVIELQADVWYLSGGGLESTQLMLDDVEKGLK
ncbi:iron complex transport system substrate-binding protein [Pilibacter termitis]|uniref:Iron complex transport system substrate-binding protein n=1 Tax=Pilibacter termitis TaxID=263852 RepID=A0A1T4NRT0_9ENTE|nr:siderophore ABC transporter substrate-binding protein [Pilibacter termitis]SJZ81805.1 iron complex transport system substrate-binding protein [Pilibacter termitis]